MNCIPPGKSIPIKPPSRSDTSQEGFNRPALLKNTPFGLHSTIYSSSSSLFLLLSPSFSKVKIRTYLTCSELELWVTMTRHPALTNYKPTPTVPDKEASVVKLPPGYTRLSNLNASKWVWDLLWLASMSTSKAGKTSRESGHGQIKSIYVSPQYSHDTRVAFSIVDIALYDCSGYNPTIHRWLFTGSNQTVMKKVRTHFKEQSLVVHTQR